MWDVLEGSREVVVDRKMHSDVCQVAVTLIPPLS